MIQENIMNILKPLMPSLLWTIDYRTANDNTGTVYATGGSSALPSDDMDYRLPTYQVYIRSSDWDFAKTASEITFNALHKRKDFIAEVPYWKDNKILFVKFYWVHQITAMSDPIRIGENGGIMEYSVNFDVVLTEMEGEITNA